MPQDYLEDRIHAAGKHQEFTDAMAAFSKSAKNRTDQSILYDKLVQLGAQDEEADEFVNMILENG